MFYRFRRTIIIGVKNHPVVQYLSEKINFISFQSKAKKRPPVFIYQMGKVASSSIYESLNEQYEGVSLHAHSFSESHTKSVVRFLFKMNEKEKINIKIISLIREPIARNISAFYENFKRDLGFEFEDNPYSTEELHELFLKDHDHKIPLIWFDHNLLKNFNIDVYQKPFPEIGYTTFKNDNIEVLLLKHDLNDKTKEAVIGTFLNKDDFTLTNYNIGTSKIYSASYKEFQKIPIPDWYITKMVDSKYVQHFYSNEIDDIINKWA